MDTLLYVFWVGRLGSLILLDELAGLGLEKTLQQLLTARNSSYANLGYMPTRHVIFLRLEELDILFEDFDGVRGKTYQTWGGVGLEYARSWRELAGSGLKRVLEELLRAGARNRYCSGGG